MNSQKGEPFFQLFIGEAIAIDVSGLIYLLYHYIINLYQEFTTGWKKHSNIPIKWKTIMKGDHGKSVQTSMALEFPGLKPTVVDVVTCIILS